MNGCYPVCNDRDSKSDLVSGVEVNLRGIKL